MSIHYTERTGASLHMAARLFYIYGGINMGYTRIEVVTSLYKLSALQKALGKLGVTGMTVFQALGCGIEKGAQEYETKERETPELLPK